MDNNAEAKLDDLNNAVHGLATLLDKDGAMCTSWILVSEWMDSEGNVWFSTHAEPELPVWRSNGLLQHAQDVASARHFMERITNEDGDI
jgi:accessory colonization factor AcfC